MSVGAEDRRQQAIQFRDIQNGAFGGVFRQSVIQPFQFVFVQRSGIHSQARMVKIGPTVAELPTESHPAIPIAPVSTIRDQARPRSSTPPTTGLLPNESKGREASLDRRVRASLRRWLSLAGYHHSDQSIAIGASCSFSAAVCATSPLRIALTSASEQRGKESAADRIPGFAAGLQPGSGPRIAADAKRNARGKMLTQGRYVRSPVARAGREFNRGNGRQGGDRPCSSSASITWVVRGLSYRQTGTETCRQTSS